MNERDRELAKYFDLLLQAYYNGNHMYRRLVKPYEGEHHERYFQNLEEALQWGLVHGKREQHGHIGFRYKSPIGCAHHILDDRGIEHIRKQIQIAREVALKENEKKTTPVRDIEAIKKELLLQFVKESQKEELSNLFSYGRVRCQRIEWQGGYRRLQEKIRPLFEDESIPHLHSHQWIHFAMNNFTKNGKDLSEKSLRNEMTRENWAY